MNHAYQPVPEPPRPLRGLWSSEALEAVEALMLDLATGERLDRLGTIVREHLATGGKRLRARLALAAIEALGAPRSHGVGWAAACELLHNASLVHDDLQDGDRFRRGSLAVWARHGAAQAINAGDVLLMLPYRAVEHAPVSDAVRWRLARCLARHAERVVRGQAEEIDLLTLRRIDWPSYAEAVRGKTAALFQLPVEGAALIAGWSAEDAERLGMAVADLGVAFQLQDDVLDLYGDKGRLERGADLREGKVSALVVEHLARHAADAPRLLSLLRSSRSATLDEDVDWAIARFAEGGALEAVWTRLSEVEERLETDPVLSTCPRLQASVVELLALALLPIRHTAPGLRAAGSRTLEVTT